MSDLATRISEHVDSAAPPIDIDALVQHLEGSSEIPLVTLSSQERRVPNRIVVLAAAAAVLVLIGGAAWLFADTGIDVVEQPGITQSRSSVPPSSVGSLVAHYPLDGTAENVVDPSGELDGEVIGPVPTTDRFGDPNGALLFDGVNDYIEVISEAFRSGSGGPSVLLTEATITAWIQTDAVPRDVYQRWDVVSFGRWEILLGVHGEGGVAAGLKAVAVCSFITEESVLDGEWHHIAMTLDKTGQTTVYLDGETQPLGMQALHKMPELPTEPAIVCREKTAVRLDFMWIGADGWIDQPEEFFDGSIDEVRIYDYVLAPEEIAALYDL